MIKFSEYIKKYKIETIHDMIAHDASVLNKTKHGGLRASLKAKLADCEAELERRKEEIIYK